MTNIVPQVHIPQLARLEAAKKALAEAVTIDEVKDIRDKAESIRAYYRQQKDGLDAQNNAAELKIRAERRLGELLAEMEKNPGTRLLGGHTMLPPETPTLAELGIAKMQSHRWQKLSSVPEPVLDQRIEEIKTAGAELTSVEMLRLATRLDRETARSKNQDLVEGVVPIPQDRRYPAIILDPPWDWRDQGAVDQFGRTKPDYATMRLTDIEALPVPDLAEDNAHLYLWVTNYCLRDGLDLCDLWGFRYITLLTWCKPSIGVGNYFRVNTEHVIFGVRGKLPLLRNDLGTHFAAGRPGPHSAKPDEFYSIVETSSPGPWLEMFARTVRSGWAQWGAEV